MGAEDLKKRIEALNKKPMKNVPETKREDSPDIKALRHKPGKQVSAARKLPASDQHEIEPVVYSRAVPAAPARTAPRAPSLPDFGPPITLEEAIDGIETEAPAGPGYYLVEMPAQELEGDAHYLHRRFVSLTGHPNGYAVERLSQVCEAERLAPDEVLFLDIETTGLSTTPLFLIGTMECREHSFRFRQYFARDYSEEMSVIAAVSERLSETSLLVTFNGKSFDVPYMHNRATATGLRLGQAKAHLDMLHEARRCYRRDLPNCKLQTLEQMICGRSREEDIPGAEIPAAYHDFVRTGNANKIRLILQHNLFDLLTMADLMHRMWGKG